MSLKKNVLANYVGQGTQALMGIVFVPVYIRYIGIESYGLIGMFALVQSWLSLIDMGMKPALGREMARFSGGAHDAQSIRNLLRSIEVVGISVAGTIALGIWAASGWLASNWVTAKTLPVDVIAQAFAVMGAVTSLRFVEDIYASSIVGLQRQVLQNTVISVMAVLRGLGAIGILAWVSPTIKAFFIWQGLMSVLTVGLFASVVYGALPPSPVGAAFSWAELVGIRRFAGGIATRTVLDLLLAQIDKILLSRLLTLESFAHYALAGVVATGLYTLMTPITVAFYPSFVQLLASSNETALRARYHQCAQLVTVLSGSAGLVLIVFGERVLRLWTGDPDLAHKVAPLLATLVLGTLLNTLMIVPNYLQIASGWTSLIIKVNVVAVCLLVPAILLIVPVYGALGAARIWVLLNVGYLLFEIPLMHRRLLPESKWRWYRDDVALPLLSAATAAFLLRWVVPVGLTKPVEFCVLSGASACVLGAAALTAPQVRDQVFRHLPGNRSLAPGSVQS